MRFEDRRSEVGATAVEYAVMLALIAAAIIAIVFILGNQTCEAYEVTSTEFAANANVTAAGTC